MDAKDLNDLAKSHVEAMLAQKLTVSELVSMLALIQARIYSRIYHDTPKVDTTPTASTEATREVKEAIPEPPLKPKSVAYDPVYDPVPQFEADKPPVRVPSTRVLAQPNHACVCAACSKVAYTVNRLIKDGDKVDDFLKSFTPMPGIPALTRKIEIMNVDGQISTDCPICKANKSLYLTGAPIHGA